MLRYKSGHGLARPLVGSLVARSRLRLVCAGGVITSCSTGSDQPDLPYHPVVNCIEWMSKDHTNV
jgi:hypothetical protein